MNRELIILSIETSCDETSIAIIKWNPVSFNLTVIAHEVYSQVVEHQRYNGVVPEIAARSHLTILHSLLEAMLKQHELTLSVIDYIAVTQAPGLLVGLMVGVMFAKGLSVGLNKPIVGLNHILGHIMSPRINQTIDFPFLALVISGGHTQFSLVESYQQQQLLGKTKDDSVGELFDKVGIMLGIRGGGKAIEELALTSLVSESILADRYPLPIPLYKQQGCDFSFSGLKTACRLMIEKGVDKADFAKALQITIIHTLIDRLNNALEMALPKQPLLKNCVIVGGVSANKAIREAMETYLASRSIQVYYAPLSLCTDNALMMAYLATERLKEQGLEGDSIRFSPLPS